MNDLEYLHQISQTNRPAKKNTGLAGIFKTKIFKFVVIGVLLIIFFAVLGGMMGKFSGKEKDSLVRINLRMTNLSSTITQYNSKVKSSRLRAMGVSLSGILSETSRDLYAVLANKYNYSEKTVDATMATEESERTANTNLVLEKAKLNGILDRTYLHQLIYEVASLMALESEAIARVGDEAVKQILQNSENSLEVLYEQLTNYSDSTN